ncbi:MAG: hypothetical protein K9N55_19790 [Phycisphaerae bacterium]|nr:hypothetical protein [Phycisphaerae bacterium]
MENPKPRSEQGNTMPRLGFHEIVPGHDHGIPQDQTQDIQIPEFDLSRHLMADQRLEATARRQGPGQKRDSVPDRGPVECVDSLPQEAANGVSAAVEDRVSAYRHPVIQRHAIVEDIVRRDIQRLCMGQKNAS